MDYRTFMLAGTQVATIAYCTISSGFGLFTHDTKVGELLTRQGIDFKVRPEAKNITEDLIAQKTDTLRAVTDYAHKHGMETFWSMRMNDTHDFEHTPKKPHFLFPKLKEEHPDWLLGEPGKNTSRGRWSSVNYAQPEIRDLAFRYIEEVCKNYDVDGVDLDFFRHLSFFRSVANGGKAKPEEVQAMTDLMRRIRKMTEEVGLKRKRPILVSMRVPDSVDFAKDLGLDIETWLKEGLMDILATTDYFRLNPWKYSVDLGHKYGVKVYPALTDPRVRGETRFKRRSVPAYRARAAKAWDAGADGLYVFNLYDVERESPLWRELGDPKALAFTDKEYFLTDLDGNPDAWLANGQKYQTIPIVTPTMPTTQATLSTKAPFKAPLMIADDLEAAARAGYEVTAGLHLDLPGIRDANRVVVALNGKELPEGKIHEGWLDWALKPDQLRKGANELSISLRPAPSLGAEEWSVLYDGEAKPESPWRRDFGSAKVREEIKDGALLMEDRGTGARDYGYYRATLGADPEGESVVEARLRVISGVHQLILSDGVGSERLEISPQGIELLNQKMNHAMDTTNDFHNYRIVFKGEDMKVYVDGELQIEAPNALAARGGAAPRNEITFGEAPGPHHGAALWDEVKFRTAGTTQVFQDAVVTLQYRKK